MGWMKVIHGYTAYVFITAVLARVIWMFTGNRYAHWDKFIPVHRSRAAAFWPTFLFYLVRPPASLPDSSATTRWPVPPIRPGLRALLSSPSAPASSMRGGQRRWRIASAMVRQRWRRSSVVCYDRPVDSSRRDVAPARLHRAPRLQLACSMSTIEANATMESIFSGYKFVPTRGSRVLGRTVHQPSW